MSSVPSRRRLVAGSATGIIDKDALAEFVSAEQLQPHLKFVLARGRGMIYKGIK